MTKGELVHELPTIGTVTFFWERNSLNNSMMYWFSHNNGMFSGTMLEVQNIINFIKLNYIK